MPSVAHQVLVELFREHPELALRLLRGVPGLELPSGVRATPGSADLGQAVPPAYAADGLIELRDVGSSLPVFALVVEVQLKQDLSKPWSWATYVANTYARLRCPVCLLVVAPRPGVARWARQRIEMGPGSNVQPVVLGPAEVPPVTDVEEARGAPELALLSVMVHGRRRDSRLAARVAAAGIAAFAGLQEERRVLYSDVLEASLSRRASKELVSMRLEGYKWQGPTARKAFAEGEARGKAEGKAEGEARGRAEAVLEALEARGLEVTRADRARILACQDLDELRTWLRRAVTVDHVADVFGR